jgi:hypothetical protein
MKLRKLTEEPIVAKLKTVVSIPARVIDLSDTELPKLAKLKTVKPGRDVCTGP